MIQACSITSPTSLPPPPPGRTGWPWTDAKPSISSKASPQPRITLVTPSFNQAAFLEETIRSVLLQGYPNLEYIIIDGGSTDGSVEIIKKYSPWIDYWTSERDRGQSHAINKGIARATGEWFNWLNSDDYLAPGALFALAKAATNQPGVVIASGITANLRGQAVFSRYTSKVPETSSNALFNLRVNQPGALMHLQKIRSAGGVSEDLNLVMDLDLWIRLFLYNGLHCFVHIDTETAVYRYHAGSKTCAGDDVFALEEFALLTDLALSFPIHALPASVASLRACVKHQPAILANIHRSLDPHAAERGWIDRMLVSDSLLFRALRRSNPEPMDALRRFIAILDDLMPAIKRHHDPCAVRNLLANALLHAMQIQGGFLWSPAWKTARLSPSFKTLRALIRLALPR